MYSVSPDGALVLLAGASVGESCLALFTVDSGAAL